MKKSVALLIALTALSGAWADQTQSKSAKETLGFDAKKVKPPDPDKGEPAARLFYDYIYPADVDAESRKLTDEEARRLTGLILGKLRQKYIEQNEITATSDEVQQFVAALDRAAAPGPIGSEKENEEIRRALKEIGEEAVKGWKFDRALYQKYGGVVIFQQANPFEPVGAYRKFLEELEEANVFEVFGEENRTKFWRYFTRKHPFQIPAQDVNFEQPWWLQKQ